MSSEIDDQLGLLFLQLAWPLCLVKERACTGIARLLVHPEYRDATLDYLLSWLHTQNLESVAAYGLLVLLRAQALDPATKLPEISAVQSALARPSILSHMLLAEIYADASLILDESLHYSHAVLTGSSVNPFFREYRTNLVPPIYQHYATVIEENEGIAFMTHWAHEWEIIVGQLAIGLTHKSLDYWMTKRHGGEHRALSDSKLSEVYRSAYLRALAWAIETGSLDEGSGCYLAAVACPVDLELWRLSPVTRPLWWPTGREVKSDLDIAMDAIWQQAEVLWEDQQHADSRLAQATGFVCEDKSVYDLEIFGMFQRCNGPEVPDLAELVEWYNEAGNHAVVSCPDRLRCRGELRGSRIEELAGRFKDWEVLPAAQHATSAGNATRWQTWRGHRLLWMPLPYLSVEHALFGFESDAIVTRSRETELGRWYDWTDGLSDTEVWPLPSRSGEVLFIPSNLIEKFESESGSSFCWVCRLRVFYRGYEHEEYKEFSDCKAFGTSHVIRP